MTTAYVPYEGSDVISQKMLEKLYATVQQYMALEAQIAAADGDRETAVNSWMETTDLAQAVKLREQIANATAKLRDLAEKNVQAVELSEEDRAKLDTEMTELKGRIKSGYTVMNNLIENMSDDPDNVKKSLETIPNPVSSNRGRKPGQAGSSLPRISATVTVHGGNFDEKDTPNEFDSFSKVAAALNCEVVDLQKAFAQAAGVAHSEIKTVAKPIEFKFQPNENGTVYTLRTEPKKRQKPGPRSSKSESVSEESPEDAPEPNPEETPNEAA